MREVGGGEAGQGAGLNTTKRSALALKKKKKKKRITGRGREGEVTGSPTKQPFGHPPDSGQSWKGGTFFGDTDETDKRGSSEGDKKNRERTLPS